VDPDSQYPAFDAPHAPLDEHGRSEEPAPAPDTHAPSAPGQATAPADGATAPADGATASANGTTAPAGNATPTADSATPTVDDVMEALANVIDPELGLDFVELGLIYGVDVDDGNVHVTFTLTTPGCPIGPQVSEQIEEFVGELDGVRNVTSEMVFMPAWSPEKMTEDAKFALGF
jgi:metal-sulfur cluster biosynthetic enzyme